jgi:hypothetical protein
VDRHATQKSFEIDSALLQKVLAESRQLEHERLVSTVVSQARAHGACLLLHILGGQLGDDAAGVLLGDLVAQPDKVAVASADEELLCLKAAFADTRCTRGDAVRDVCIEAFSVLLRVAHGNLQ